MISGGVMAKGFHGWFVWSVLEEGDFDTKEPAYLKDDLASEPEEAILVSEDQFFDFSLEKKEEQFTEARFFVVKATAKILDYQIDRLFGLRTDKLLLAG
jgi:hypothetical protein